MAWSCLTSAGSDGRLHQYSSHAAKIESLTDPREDLWFCASFARWLTDSGAIA